LKIALVLTNPPKPSETFLNSLIQILSKEHQLTLFLSKKSKDFKNVTQYVYLNNSVGPVNVIVYALKCIVNYKKFKKLRKTTRVKLLLHDIPVWTTTNLDYVHYVFGNLAFGREYYAEAMGCKMSLSFRGSDINVFPKWHNLSYDLILEKCHIVQCNSNLLKAEAIKYNSNVETKIAVINPGLLPKFNVSVEEIELLQQKRLKNNSTKFISIGRLHWIKGFELIFEALSKLKKEGFDFDYQLIGQGPEEEKLIFLSHFYEIQENVKFLGLEKPAKIRTYLESANVFIQTSWAEGFSNSTMEAQALGLPVIVTPISGMNELVLHEETGYITQSHGSEDILNGIKWYLTLDQESKRTLSIKANLKVRDNFSMEQLIQNWRSFFN
jgi:colanic acid/amylovoran biosynthesis glycosyltransferase